MIPPRYDGRKAVHFLRGGAGFSARLVMLLKRTENGLTRGGMPLRTIDILRAGDNLCVRLPASSGMPEAVAMPLDILFEDADLLAMNKPPGLAMHPTHNHQGDTLANAVAAHMQQQGLTEPMRAVGRLDKGTSGVVLCAKNAFAAAKLTGAVKKEYLAVAGGLFQGKGKIDMPILRPDPMKTLRACGEGGDFALTQWESLQVFPHLSCTLLRIRPQTGRTHQIRVHFASMGAPLLGDSMYGGSRPEIGRPLLHCESARFPHPLTGEMLCIQAPPHPDFQAYLS